MHSTLINGTGGKAQAVKELVIYQTALYVVKKNECNLFSHTETPVPYIIAATILIIVVYYAIWQHQKRFVRAFIYMETYNQAIADGKDQETAIASSNQIANAIFSQYGSSTVDNDAIYRAKAHAAMHYNKKQGPVIKKAKELGFFG